MRYRIAPLTAALALLLSNQAHAEVDFVKEVQPIIEKTCLKCHIGEKPRGGLRLDTKENMMKGGKLVKVVVVPGKAADSPLYKLVNLPEDDENRMPPLVSEKPLPKAQANKLRDWINEGAKWPNGLVLKSAATSGTEIARDDPGVPITDAEKAAVAKLEKTGVLAIRLAQNTNLLRVDFSLRGKEVKEEDLKLLKDMPNLTELNLGGTTVTDSGLVNLKELKNLTRLNLHGTKITDPGLANLKDLTKLTSLNLYGSDGITDAGLEYLKGLKDLKKLYLWQTKVTGPAARKLSEATPGLIVDRGYDAADAPKPKDTPKEKK